VFLNISGLKFDFVVCENGKLMFYNSFKYESTEDFIYYVLFAIKQLNLNTETLILTLLGEIEADSSIYKILHKYIRNIEFINRKSTGNYSEEIKKLPSHYHYTLLNK